VTLLARPLVSTLLRLPWLAPDIATALVNERQPPQLNAKKLMRLTARLSSDWVELRALLGFTQDKTSAFELQRRPSQPERRAKESTTKWPMRDFYRFLRGEKRLPSSLCEVLREMA